MEIGLPEETPSKRKYPERNRKKIEYFDCESSFEERPKKLSKLNLSHPEQEDDKENSIDSDTENNTIQELSEYEKLRLKNIEENRRVMLELGLVDAAQKLNEEKTKKKKKRNLKPRIPKPKITPSSTKRSLRLLKKTPEGKDIPLDVFQDTPRDSPVVEEKTRIMEEILPMVESGESTDFLDSLKDSLTEDSAISSLESADSLINDIQNLKFAELEKIVPTRIQSLCVHPTESKLLIIAGSKNGDLGLWNVSEGSTAVFQPHLRAINCISVSDYDQSKFYTTSHDGTVRRADLHKSIFDLVYQTDEKTSMCHITWHTQIDANTIMVAHGTGEAGVVDLRTKAPQRWFHCHQRSVRTIHHHPVERHYFLTSSGTGECKIWDLRGSKKHVDEHVGDLSITKTNKGTTSAFFSPDGKKIVTTCNDDCLRIYDSTDLADPKEMRRVLHDNHTGRWLSVFKAAFHPQDSDLILIGSMLYPRRIQMYNASGVLVKELKDEENLATIVPVIALHPTQSVLVGGNSSGKGHLFTSEQCRARYIKEKDSKYDD